MKPTTHLDKLRLAHASMIETESRMQLMMRALDNYVPVTKDEHGRLTEETEVTFDIIKDLSEEIAKARNKIELASRMLNMLDLLTSHLAEVDSIGEGDSTS